MASRECRVLQRQNEKLAQALKKKDAELVAALKLKDTENAAAIKLKQIEITDLRAQLSAALQLKETENAAALNLKEIEIANLRAQISTFTQSPIPTTRTCSPTIITKKAELGGRRLLAKDKHTSPLCCMNCSHGEALDLCCMNCSHQALTPEEFMVSFYEACYKSKERERKREQEKLNQMARDTKKAVLHAFGWKDAAIDPVVLQAACGFWEGANAQPREQRAGMCVIKNWLDDEDFVGAEERRSRKEREEIWMKISSEGFNGKIMER